MKSNSSKISSNKESRREKKEKGKKLTKKLLEGFAKDQLISEGIFIGFKSPKKQTKFIILIILSDCHNSDVINSLLNAFSLKKILKWLFSN